LNFEQIELQFVSPVRICVLVCSLNITVYNSTGPTQMYHLHTS